MGGDGAGGFGLRTTIAAITGGTASALGGGKFANGAISGAFVHMFNAEAKAFLMKNSLSKEEIMSRDKTGREAYMKQKLQSGSEWMNRHPAGDGSNLKTFWGIVTAPLAVIGITKLLSIGETMLLTNPAMTTDIVLDFTTSSLCPSLPAGSTAGFAGWGTRQVYDYYTKDD
ncbi:MAG: hypothetical protein ABXS91_09310 [Sulfurimonas sp.]